LAPLLRVRPELQQLCRFGAQWSSDHSSEAEGWAPFHFVTQGTCIIELSGRSILLSAGSRTSGNARSKAFSATRSEWRS
jgi:AraC family transcriptional activator of mtrCDE